MAPQSHPQAQFVPISPELDLASLVESTPNFDYVTRLPREMLDEHSIQSLEQLVLLHVVIGGKPLVIEGWEDRIDPYLFGPAWLQDTMDKKAIKARDLPTGIDVEMTMGHYLRNLPRLASQITRSNYRDDKRQRLYLKDMDTPDEWMNELRRFIPETFYYLNECIEPRTGGDGAILEANEYGQMRYGKGVAPAGDLMSMLPPEMQALNMMCYIGHEGTYTPAHREMCASLGHNIMVDASEDRNGEKPGSSVWLMTETKEREVVSEYFLSMLGHDIEVEKHFAQINAWKKAPFNVWVVEQKVGDLILIPPLAPHQVWNRGTRTIKAAWNRTTVDTLELAIHEALPRARMVCRDEQYKNKAIIYFTLQKYHELLQRDTVEPKMWRYGRIKQLLDDFKRLFQLFGEVLVSEMFGSQLPVETNVELLPFDSNVTCSYCRCNIFNRFLTCKSCNTGDDDTYDICMECYAMGRSCSCISNLNWVEQWKWSTLLEHYETWRQMIVTCDGNFDIQKSPQPIEVARKRYGRKPVAQICQEQLKIRPWQDPSKPVIPPPSPGMSDVEPETDDHGRPKKKRPFKRRMPFEKDKMARCHVAGDPEWRWKLAFCTTCTACYSYGVLWRAFDIMPQEVMEDRDWSCPKCRGICSCGRCRKTASQNPYAPKGTLLGHDTRLVADARSVESLVDFSKTNLRWLRGENDDNPQESSRMKRLKEKAEAAKAREDVIDENYFDNPERQEGEGNDMVDANPPEPAATSVASIAYTPNDSYRSPYAAQEVNQQPNFDGNYEHAENGWLDGHYDLEFDAYNRPSTEYPSRLLEPVEPPEQLYANPADLTNPRMMGAGYYQQRDSVDMILYDPPSMNTDEGAVDPSILRTAANASLALSDLVPHVEETKKRKHGVGEYGEDVEFVGSKRQKKPEDRKSLPRRSAGKPRTYLDPGEDTMPFTEDDMVPSRKPKVDNDDDEWALAAQAMSQLSELPDSQIDSAQPRIIKRRRRRRPASPPNVSPAAPKPRKSAWLARKQAEVSDEEFPSELPARKRRVRVISESNEIFEPGNNDYDDGPTFDDDDGSLFGDPDAPEEAVEAGIEWRVSAHNSNVRIAEPLPTSNAPAGKRRGRPPKIISTVAKVKIEDPESGSTTPNVQVELAANEQGSTPKRRGRPPKSVAHREGAEGNGVAAYEVSTGTGGADGHGQLSSPTLSAHPTDVHFSESRPIADEPISPLAYEESGHDVLEIEATGAVKPKIKRSKELPTASGSAFAIELPGVKRMLSLKEKLSMKGKPFRIVAGKSRRTLDSPVDHSASRSTSPTPRLSSVGSMPSVQISRSTPSIVLPAFSPTGWSAVNGTPRQSSLSTSVKLNGNGPINSLKQNDKRISTPVTHSNSEPVKKVPTVVRLDSPEALSESDEYSSTDSSDSDSSIPAVRRSPKVSDYGGRGLASVTGR